MPGDLAWDDLRLVLEIARGRTLAPAADALGLNVSTVFRRLGTIEEDLGLKLFDRHRSGYVPTQAGQDMVALAGTIDEGVGALARRLAGRSPDLAGDLRVTTNDTLLVHLLTPVFASFRDRHPGIRLDIVVANESLNLARRDADVAIRATVAPPDTLVGRRIGEIGWALYGRRDRDGTDPAAGNWIGLGETLADGPVERHYRAAHGGGPVVYRVNTVLGLREALEAGIGIGALPCFLGDASPHLVRLAPPLRETGTALWLLTHPDLRDSPRVRAAMDHFGRELAKLRARLAGEA